MGRRFFTADGIRGLVNQHPFTPHGMERLGDAIAAWLHERSLHRSPCLIGNDTRESGTRLKLALAHGITRAGISVIDAGILPTPAVSYLLAKKGIFSAGIMVSASHNVVAENGVKIFDSRGIKLEESDEGQIEDFIIRERKSPLGITRQAPVIPEATYSSEYATLLAREYQGFAWNKLRIVLDLANGAAYRTAPQVLDNLQIAYRLINATPDGTNINFAAGSENVRRNPDILAKYVADYDATVGVSLDGDADRMLIVDRNGRIYDGDMTLAILATHLQKKNQLRGNTTVATQMSNSGLSNYLAMRGIHTQIVKNGDKYVTSALLERDLALGGEEIGHVILHTDKHRVTGDGLRAALHILSILATEQDSQISELAPGMRKWPQVRASVHLGGRTDTQSSSIAGLHDLLTQVQMEIPDLTHLECRPASTEPSYRIMIEARTTPTDTLVRYAQRLAHHIQIHLGYHGRQIDILTAP